MMKFLVTTENNPHTEIINFDNVKRIYPSSSGGTIVVFIDGTSSRCRQSLDDFVKELSPRWSEQIP